ncbi:hypothetical protein MMC08_007978 [Hypocenomyce scalaris]|nr:hypothetical protein [Hypocenomyce scalaris]
MAKHRKPKQNSNHNSRSQGSTEARAFEEHGSNNWEEKSRRRENHLGSHLVTNARVERQNHSERPWCCCELGGPPHHHREFDNSRPHLRRSSASNALQLCKDSRYQKFDHIIRDLFVQGSIIEQKLKRLLDGLAYIQPSPEEMEWENTSCIYFVPQRPVGSISSAPLALTKMVNGQRAEVVASSIRQEHTGSERPGLRIRVPSLLGPQSNTTIATPFKHASQDFGTTLVHTAAVAAPNHEGHPADRTGPGGVAERLGLHLGRVPTYVSSSRTGDSAQAM